MFIRENEGTTSSIYKRNREFRMTSVLLLPDFGRTETTLFYKNQTFREEDQFDYLSLKGLK